MWLQLRILALIALVTIINYFDRSAISFAIQPIEHTFGINNAEFGWIAGAFGIGYLVTAPFGGMLVDRFGPLIMWLISAIAWSLFTIGMGLGSSFTSFFVLTSFAWGCRRDPFSLPAAHGGRLAAPINARQNACHRPCRNPPLFAHRLPFLGQASSTTFGWKAMFFVSELWAYLGGSLWVINFSRKSFPSKERSKSGKKAMLILETSSGWKHILSSTLSKSAASSTFALGTQIFFALMWLPGYLQQTYGIDIQQTGVIVMIPWLVSSILLFLGGSISDKLLKKTRDLHKARSCLIGACMGISGILFLLIPLSSSLFLDMTLYSLALGTAFAINAPIYSLNGDLFPRHPGARPRDHDPVLCPRRHRSPGPNGLSLGYFRQLRLCHLHDGRLLPHRRHPRPLRPKAHTRPLLILTLTH